MVLPRPVVFEAEAVSGKSHTQQAGLFFGGEQHTCKQATLLALVSLPPQKSSQANLLMFHKYQGMGHLPRLLFLQLGGIIYLCKD